MRPGRHPAPHREGGFALAETLVALAVIATMTALFYDSIVVDARATQMAAARRGAALVARSVLDAVSAPGATPLEGRQGEFVWRAQISSFEQGARDSGPPLELVSVSVTQPPSDRPLVRLQTLRLGR